MTVRAWKNPSGCFVSVLICFTLLLIPNTGKNTAQAQNQSSLHQTIHVVMDDDYPPYVFQDSGGRLKGILPDLWSLWEKKNGIHVQITAIKWAEAERRMQLGEFDVIDTIFENEEREKVYDFSKPYAKIEVPITFRSAIPGIKSVNDLKGFQVAVKSGDNAISVLHAHGITNLVAYDNYEDIVVAARDHRVDVFVIDQPPALYYLYKLGIYDQYRMSDLLYTGAFHRAVLKGNHTTLQIVENGFAKISQDEIKKIEKYWYGRPILPPKIQRYILIGVLSVSLVFLSLFFWLWTLRRMVAERTTGLQLEVQNRKRHEKLLQEQEEKYRSLFHNSEVSLFSSTCDGSELIEINKKFCELIGRKREQILGKPLSAFWADQGEYQELLKNLLKNDRILEFEAKLVHEQRGPRNCLISLRRFQGTGIIEGSVTDITEWRQMVEALKLLTMRQEALLEAIPDIIMEADPQKLYTWANSEGIDFFGNDVVGKPAEFYFAGEQDTYKILQPIYEGKEKVIYVESWQRRRDGQVRLLAWWCKALENEDGFVTGTLSTARDITDRKNLEFDLANREREYRTLIENFPDCIVRYNTKLQRIYVNPAWEEVSGIRAEDALNKVMMDIPERQYQVDPQYMMNTLKKALSTRSGQVTEFPWINAKGEKIFMEYHVVPEYDGQGSIVSLLAIGRDITDQKNLELDLAKREREYRTLIENCPDFIIRYNTELQRTYVNPAWEKASGIKADCMLNKVVTSIPELNYRVDSKYIDTVKKVLSTGRRQSMEIPWVNVNGNELFLEFVVVPEYDEENNIVSLLTVGRDITELKRSLQRILDEQQLINDMTFKLSVVEERERHRIATDLHDTIGQDLALARIKLGELRKEINRVENSKKLDEISLIMENAIKGVRHLTRMISPPILESAGLESALKWLARQMKNDYSLSVIFNDDLLPKQIHRDFRIQVYNCVRELLINVAKHAKTNEADLTLCRIDDSFVVKVEDNGVGFTFAHTMGQFKMDGFGLFNVQKIIDNMGGSFIIDSKPENGTCVTITIPILAMQVES